MYLQNVPQAMITLLAAWKCGAVVVPCNPMLRDRELTKILVDSGTRVLICLDDLYDDVAVKSLPATAVETTITTSARDFLSATDDPDLLRGIEPAVCAGSVRLLDLLAQHHNSVPPPLELTGDDIALMVYTSGTTGAPKAATNTHRNVVFATTVYQQWLQLGPQDPILGLAPLFHVTGLIGHLSLAALAGSPLVLFYRFDADEACRLAERYRTTFTVSAVTAFIALLNSAAIDKYDLSALTKVYTGGAPTPVAALHDWHRRTGTRIHPMYGLTEATSPTHMTPFGQQPPVDPTTGVVSVGVPVFNTDVRVITEDGTTAGAHEIGELHITGPQIIPGYWQKPEETAEALTAGYLRTGDVGFMDEDGWFYLVDRAKDMIVASGFKVWPREVEEVLYQHPAVLEAAVVGVPDAYRGETVKAYVSLKAGAQATADEIKAFARERMAAYKYPRMVEITDEIPKNASGKVLRRVFQEKRRSRNGSGRPLRRPPGGGRSPCGPRTRVWCRCLAGGAQVRAGRAVGLYRRLETMLAQVRADGHYVDRGAVPGRQPGLPPVPDRPGRQRTAVRRIPPARFAGAVRKGAAVLGCHQRTGHHPTRTAHRRRRRGQRARRPPGHPDLDRGIARPGQTCPRRARQGPRDQHHRRPGEFGHRQRARRQCRSPFPSPGSRCTRRGPRRSGRPGDRGPAVDRQQTHRNRP